MVGAFARLCHPPDTSREIAAFARLCHRVGAFARLCHPQMTTELWRRAMVLPEARFLDSSLAFSCLLSAPHLEIF